MKKTVLLVLLMISLSVVSESRAQDFLNLGFLREEGLQVSAIVTGAERQRRLPVSKPLFSFLANGKEYTSEAATISQEEARLVLSFSSGISVSFTSQGGGHTGWKGKLVFQNQSTDTIILENVVPFGTGTGHVYITGKGPWDLSRAWLFRPEKEPLRVILPDNAWELGYCSFRMASGQSVASLARRTKVTGGTKQRYKTVLPPRASVHYTLYADFYAGPWQNGLKMMFRERYLYDLDVFDTRLYEREDLSWVRNTQISIFQFAWDKGFYDRLQGRYRLYESLDYYSRYFGKVDIYGIWPTWPRLGLDKRNQFDLFRSLPGGVKALREISDSLTNRSTRFFLAYNPWDLSTRKEEHYTGLASLIQETDADGVVLDTRGKSNRKLQQAADSIKEGVVMYSEGMAVPEDMPGIISGRVHNALYLSAPLNMNKLIKPDFTIFRVLDIGEDRLHREAAVAFFNGYGCELNLFRPGRGDWMEKDLQFLGKTTQILRQNNHAFMNDQWTPLVATAGTGTWVNHWKSGPKEIYTVLSFDPQGIDRAVIPAENRENMHAVSLWHHEELEFISRDGSWRLPVKTKPYPSSWKGTRREGRVDCIAVLPELLHVIRIADSLGVRSEEAGEMVVWAGDPAYQTDRVSFTGTRLQVSLSEIFGYQPEKVVVQLLRDGQLADERISFAAAGEPWLISVKKRSRITGRHAGDMVLVPGDSLQFNVTNDDQFIPYPQKNQTVYVDSFLMDIYPVTNQQFFTFLEETQYMPGDTSRFLRHWEEGLFPQGQEDYPVVNVSYEDAQAYARWAGKRLPSEKEWQLAAQGTDGRKWPWGNDFHGTKCNNAFDRPTPVDAFDRGRSVYGVADLVGNVWQMTRDMYFNGDYYFLIIRGGSYFNPRSSWWYIQGGPQPLDRTQMLLLVSPGYDRSETVGFRCVRDIN